MSDEKIKQYLIERSGGEQLVVTIPSSWKVTFGALHPGGRENYDGQVLRMYESQNQQRAVFTNVRSFRDLSIKIKRRIVNVDEKKEFMKRQGKEMSSSEVKVQEIWVDANVSGS